MNRPLSMLIAAALVAVCLWIAIPTRPRDVPVRPPAARTEPPQRVVTATPARSVPVAGTPDAEPAYYRPLDRLNAPGQDIDADLKLLVELFFHYQIAVKDPSGNPVGDHAEIVRALQGRNRARLAFLPAQHPALNEAGELVDRWGTPFFFHAVSGTRMEIRSAGPDRRMWTDDDAVNPKSPPPSRPHAPDARAMQ